MIYISCNIIHDLHSLFFVSDITGAENKREQFGIFAPQCTLSTQHKICAK